MTLDDLMLPCMSKSLFGVDCPGCGMQRSLLLLLKGDFENAFHMFPAIYTTILFLLFLVLNFADKSRNYHSMIRTVAIVNAIIMIVSFIYKQTH